MYTALEIRQLLDEVIEAWPEGYDHPSIEQAREYLQSSRPWLVASDVTNEQHEENYLDAMWYSI
jgi:hypothetical protein